MKIFAQCLACYNNGNLNGSWFDLKDYVDADKLQSAINEKVLHSGKGVHEELVVNEYITNEFIENDVIEKVLRQGVCPHEEFAIHDYDDFPNMGEYPCLYDLFEVKELLETHGQAFNEAMEYMGENVEDAKRMMEGYCGKYKSEKDFAEEWFEQCYADTVPEHIQRWIDIDQVAYDIFIDDYIYLEGHVFSRNY